jgi:transposase
VGIDDFAWKKGLRYGTLFVDLQTKNVLGLLPTREKEAVQAWIEAHPDIELITRDRSRSYKAAVEAASPAIRQVGDRWHVLRLLHEAAKKTVQTVLPARWFPEAPEAFDEGPAGPLPKRLQSVQEQEEALWERIQEVHRLRGEGQTITAIAEEMHLSRNTVYSDLLIHTKPSLRRSSVYEAYLPLIRNLLAEGYSGEAMEAACREAGFDGHRKTLAYLVADERRQRKRPRPLQLRRAVLDTIWDESLTHPEDTFHAIHPNLLAAFPGLREVREFVQSFRQLFQDKHPSGLRLWLQGHPRSSFAPLQAFIEGIRRDLQATYYAVTLPWSNGLMEGMMNKLKTIKRMMYGRAGLPVLRQRLQFSSF